MVAFLHSPKSKCAQPFFHAITLFTINLIGLTHFFLIYLKIIFYSTFYYKLYSPIHSTLILFTIFTPHNLKYLLGRQFVSQIIAQGHQKTVYWRSWGNQTTNLPISSTSHSTTQATAAPVKPRDCWKLEQKLCFG